MSVYGLKTVGVKEFRGLNTLLDPASCPPEVSPDCQDVQFPMGSVTTRPGLTLVRTLSGKINGLKSFILPDLTQLLLSFLSTNDIYADGSLVRTLASYTGARMNSVTAFGREYMAFSDGKVGAFNPMAYDGTNLDRVSPDGPYGRGTAAGAFHVADSASAGNISAGLHNAVVLFVFRSGFVSRPMPVEFLNTGITPSWTAGGALSVDATAIPLGPTGCIGRIIAFTALGGSSYFYIPGTNMDIRDNTTTSKTINFTDAQLLAGENVDDLFRQVTLPPCAGVTFYSGRLFWWGLLHTLAYESETTLIALGGPPETIYPVLPNSSFDGDFTTSGGVDYPNPQWGTDGFPAGLIKETSDTLNGTGFAIRITGDGATAVRGAITSSVQLGFWNPSKTYKVSAWVKRSSGLAAGTFKFYCAGAASTGLAVTAAQASTTWQRFEATIRTSADAVTLADLNLRVDGTPTNANYFLIDDARIFESDLPYLGSKVAVSRPEEPDHYDGVDGFMLVAENNGQAVRNGFVIRDFLYLVKEHSLHITSDNGDEPANWPIREVSATVGTPSLRGVGLGDEWAVIAGMDGAYFFDGSPITEANFLSREIQPTWDRINKTYAHLMEVKVDTKNKRILIAVPLDSATEPSHLLVLDYRSGFGEGKRKWCPWVIPCNAMAIVQPSGATLDVYIGNNTGNGKIWKLDDAALSDDGVAINSYWQSGYFQSPERLMFGYLTSQITGAGVCALTLYRGGQTDSRQIRGWTLEATGITNRERQIRSVRERLAIKVGTNYASHWFQITTLNMFLEPSQWSPIRGHNR